MEGNKVDEELEVAAADILKRLKELENSSEWKESATKPCKQYKMAIEKRIATKGIAVAAYPFDKVY